MHESDGVQRSDPEMRSRVSGVHFGDADDHAVVAHATRALLACRDAVGPAEHAGLGHRAGRTDVLEDRLAVGTYVAAGLELGDIGRPALLALDGLNGHRVNTRRL